MKKIGVLLSLTSLLLTGCRSDENKVYFNIVVDKCMPFLKEKYLRYGDCLSTHENEHYGYDLRNTSIGFMMDFYAYQTLINDGTIPITWRTITYSRGSDTWYLRYYGDIKLNRFYIDYSSVGEVGRCCDAECGTMVSEYFERIEIDYNYETNTVNSIADYSASCYEYSHKKSDVSYKNNKINNSDIETCLDRSKITDEERAKCINEFVEPFSWTFAEALEIDDISGEISRLRREMEKKAESWSRELTASR